MIWLQILQGLASHVNANAEELRHHFVTHEGKKVITIRRDRFVKGNPDNDWEGAFNDRAYRASSDERRAYGYNAVLFHLCHNDGLRISLCNA